MSEKYKIQDPDGLYFVTCTIVFWIDLFTRKELKHLIIQSLIHSQQKKGLVVHAWCLMPSHLHMIISTNDKPLPDILRDFKKFTSKAIVGEITKINESRSEWLLRAFENARRDLKRISNYKVWHAGTNPRPLRRMNYWTRSSRISIKTLSKPK